MTKKALDFVCRYEWLILIVFAPVLMFPSVRPRLTVVVLAALVLLWLTRLVARKQAWPVTPFNGALLFLAIAIFVSMLVSAVPALTIPKATNLILGIAAFRAIAFAVHDERSLGWGVLTILAVGLGIIAVGVLSTRWSAKVPALAPLLKYIPQVFNQLPELSEKGGVNPNQLGGVLALYVPLVGGLLVGASGSRLSRAMRLVTLAFLGFLFAVAAFVLVLTQSRSGWAGGIVGMMTVLCAAGLVSPHRSVRRVTRVFLVILFLVAVAAVLAACCLWTTPFHELWSSVTAAQPISTDVGNISTRGRLEIWARAFYAMQDFSFTGIGLGTFRKVIPILYPYFTISPTIEVPHAHDIFLQVGVDTGFPGLISYLAVLLVAVVICVRGVRMRNKGWVLGAALGVFGGVVGLHVYGLTDALAPGSKPAVLFWMALGILAGLENVLAFVETDAGSDDVLEVEG